MRMDAGEQQVESSPRRSDPRALVSLTDLKELQIKQTGTSKESHDFLDFGTSKDVYKLDDELLELFGMAKTLRPTKDAGDQSDQRHPHDKIEDHAQDSGPGSKPNHKFLFGGNAHGTLESLESAIGGKANLEMFRVRPGNKEQMDHVREDLAKGVTPEVSLNGEFFHGGDKAIAAGRYDKQLSNMAHELSQMKNPDGTKAEILMRFGKEMNLQHKFVGSGQDYVDAFQKVHDVFQAAGADNVKLVWCPTRKIDPTGLKDEANPDKYWPGSKYVDVIGPDGYSPKHNEESFQKIFQPFVDLAKRTGKPFMTSETGIHTDGMTEKQKSDWWQNAFDYVQNERNKGTDIMGVGGFFRHPETNETLTDNQRQVLAKTFIKAEGTTGNGAEVVKPEHHPDHPGHHRPPEHERPGHDKPHHCHPHPGHRPPNDGPIPPDYVPIPPVIDPIDQPPPDHMPIPPVIDPIDQPPPDHVPIPPVIDPIDQPPPDHVPIPPVVDPPPPPGSNPPPDILFGGYTNGSWHGNEARESLDREIGGKAELEQFYRQMGGSIRDLKNYIQGDLDRGILPEVSLNPRRNNFNYTDVAAGKHDDYFRELASQLASMKDAEGKPAEILLRPGWEFNLRWMKNMGTSDQFVAAFQHMHDIFKQEGAQNVKFVWSPGSRLDMSGLGHEPDLQHYWPGSDYVDVVGPDGYSNTQRHESFDEIFKPAMDLAQRIGKPFMASETGVDRTGLTDKQTADWWRSAFETLQRRQAEGLEVKGVAAFMKSGDFGWGFRDYTIKSGEEQNALRETFLQ